MLHCVSHVKLPATPKQVVLQHHTQGGVAITAVAYSATTTVNYFTIAELRTPNTEGAPMRVIHVRAPGQFVSSLALGRSGDGVHVYVIAQCGTVREDGRVHTKVHIWRREVEVSEEGDAENVQYKRMPRAVRGLDGEDTNDESAARVWTTSMALTSAENLVEAGGVASSSSWLSNTPSSATRVVAAAGGGSSAEPVSLQVLSVEGTRGVLEYTVELPVLSGFPVEEMVMVPGCADRLILRCHHVLVEVDLIVCERVLASQQQQEQQQMAASSPASASAAQPPTVRTNEAVTRVWRWTPRDRLTGLALKDSHVYATTEEGVVLLWDYQQAGAAVVAPGTAQQQHPRYHSNRTGVSHTGIYAPYATDFVTCGVDGSVLSWGYSNLQDQLEAGVVGLSALSDFAKAAADAAVQNTFPFTPSPADGSRSVPYLPQTLLKAYALDPHDSRLSVVVESSGVRRYDGERSGAAGRTNTVNAAHQAALWLGRQMNDTQTLRGTAGESCVGLSGDGNLVAVVGDMNSLRLYLCQ